MRLNNPNRQEIPGPIRDPMIVYENERYYMVGTSPEFWEGYNPGVRMWSSTDLIHWRFETLAISSDAIGENEWCKNRFWAPELFPYHGRYYITVSCRNEKGNTPFGMFIAQADAITGPYTLMSREPFQKEGIDASLFEDDDGTVYMTYGNLDLYMMTFDLEAGVPTSSPQKVVLRGEDGEWDSIGVEGGFIVKRQGIYYLWYSSWTRGYEMGWATTDSLKKPFVKWPDNPVISGHGSAFPFAGHNAAFRLKDGRDAISFHGHAEGEEPRLCIDVVTYPMKSRAPSDWIEVQP